MQFTPLVLAALPALVAAQYSNTTSVDIITVTEEDVVTLFTTYCPEPTTFVVNNRTVTVTAPTTITITDCPCTVKTTYTTTGTAPTTTIPTTTTPAAPTSTTVSPPTSTTPTTTTTPTTSVPTILPTSTFGGAAVALNAIGLPVVAAVAAALI